MVLPTKKRNLRFEVIEMRLLSEEMYQLHKGDHFALASGGEVFTVSEESFIDPDGQRQVLYQSRNGLQAHRADHTKVWGIVP